MYEGEIDSQGKFDGRGIILYPNGTLYEGYFARGKRNGKGLLIKSDYEYVHIGENFND